MSLPIVLRPEATKDVAPDLPAQATDNRRQPSRRPNASCRKFHFLGSVIPAAALSGRKAHLT